MSATKPGTVPFQLAIFLGAYLLFLVQPLIAKQILPWFGGAPAVWTTCLLFFQLALVFGYAYAHLSRRVGLRRQIGLHVALLALGLLTLPIAASAAWKPPDAENPIPRVLALLTMSVGAPYVLLSATAPLIQDWYARAVPDRSPYRLYVLSNTGSLLALLSYPVLVEPNLPVAAQSMVWSSVFVLFTVACAWSAWRTLQHASPAGQAPVPVGSGGPAPSALDRVLWVALAAVASGLLLAVTNQLCQDVAVVPLLWIVPLSLYLITFILCFAGLYRRSWWVVLFAVGLAATGYSLANATTTSLIFQAVSLLLLLTSSCMICHGELVHVKPAVAHLTAFYLAMSIGGSLGGLFVALAAPFLFVNYAELPFLVMLVPGLLLVVAFRDSLARQGKVVPALVWIVPMVVFAGAILVVLRAAPGGSQTVATGRNFYGILRVADDAPGAGRPLRGLYHGRVLHGAQFLDPAEAMVATTYFAKGSGAELAIRRHPARDSGQPLRIGIVGLGAGTIAAWGQPGDRIRFFELNPQVVEFARAYFTFLSGSAATVDVSVGDARLSLEREMTEPGGPGSYDVLIVDAFSGDSIPVHLLTREALALYRQALAPDGVLALHISNHYLDIAPVVRGLAAETALPVVELQTSPDAETAARTSLWMLATTNQDFLQAVDVETTPQPDNADTVVWTDTFSSLLSVLRHRP